MRISNYGVHDGSKAQEMQEAGGLMVGSWCYIAMLFNICLRAKVRVMKTCLVFVFVLAFVRRCVDMHG
jgi:hypothetical protein